MNATDMNDTSWKITAEKKLSDHFNAKVQITSITGLSGGDINEAYQLETDAGLFFIKLNGAKRYPGMFKKEEKGIHTLAASGVISLPEVIVSGEDADTAFLILHFIRSRKRQPHFWDDFGGRLAALHRQTHPHFGLDYDNYIGSLHQSNTRHDTWTDFFREERLEAQLRLARDKGRLGREVVSRFENFYGKLDEIFPVEPPALIHGDLWGGNYMVGEDGLVVLIDPAVYYGHREMDLAMSRLFGGFDAKFYEGYQRNYPLEPGWQQRLSYCNLYPLLVHLNLFGGAYLGSIQSILKQF